MIDIYYYYSLSPNGCKDLITLMNDNEDNNRDDYDGDYDDDVVWLFFIIGFEWQGCGNPLSQYSTLRGI